MRKANARLALFGGVLLFALLLGLLLGAANLHMAAVWGGDSTALHILRYVRLPRVLAAALAGAALSVAGVVIQTVLANPLASPGVLGINAGAGLGVAIAAAAAPGLLLLLPAAAFLGALATALLVYAIACKAGVSRITLLLAGIALSSLMTAGINTVTHIFPELLLGLREFQIGGFAGLQPGLLLPAGLVILAGVLAALLLAGELEILGLGEETALSLGLRVPFYRFLFLTLAALLAGAAVSFAGLLGFVGLMVPHITRMLLPGQNKRRLLLGAALLGAAFLILCDTLARTAFAPHELPVGIPVSILGAPFFLWLLLRERRRHHA